MTAPAPMFASEKKAAQLLDMKTCEFRKLVDDGHLPPPRNLGGLQRWDMAEVHKIASGDAVEGLGSVNW